MSKGHFCIYKTATGEPVLFGLSGNVNSVGYEPDESIFYGRFSPDQHKINPATGEREDKTVFHLTYSALTAGVDETITVSNIPAGTKVGLRRMPKDTTNNGVVEFTADEAGTYTLYLVHDDYVPLTLELVVT